MQFREVNVQQVWLIKTHLGYIPLRVKNKRQ